MKYHTVWCGEEMLGYFVSLVVDRHVCGRVKTRYCFIPDPDGERDILYARLNVGGGAFFWQDDGETLWPMEEEPRLMDAKRSDIPKKIVAAFLAWRDYKDHSYLENASTLQDY